MLLSKDRYKRGKNMDRKKIKKQAKMLMKKHFGFLVAICLVSAMITSEFGGTLSWIFSQNNETINEEMTALPSDLSTSKVLQDIFDDNLDAGEKMADEIKQKEISSVKNPAFGRSRGVFAALINSITSGSIFLSMVAAVNSMVGSESLAVLLLILLGLFVFLMFWFYVQNTYAVVLRRMFLESRTYQKIPFERFMFLSRIKRWTRASFIMFVRYVLYTLWSLTIVGAFVKHYSYLMVPFIVAENPDIKALEAITLSRKMMNGHKWECFKIDVSMLGWTILSSCTLGLSAAFFSNPYKMMIFCEVYVHLREKAKAENLVYSECLNDMYLYAKASEETLKEAYPEIKNKDLNVKPLPGIRGFFANYFGILFKEGKAEREYQKESHKALEYASIKEEAEGNQYPTRLFTIPEENKRVILSRLDPARDYTIWSLILMFFIFSCIGWLWEVSLHLITDGVFVNRGAMHGPWLPIYGSGGILILTLLKKFRDKPYLCFILIFVLCGFLEYTTSYVMEMNTGLKWWDYSGYFLNLDGRICAEGLCVFGIGGMAFIYVLAPVFDNMIAKIKPMMLRVMCVFLLMLFGIDMVYSHYVPNVGEGITDYGED